MKAADFLLGAFRSKAEHSSRIHPSAEEHAHRNVRDHVLLDNFRQQASAIRFPRPSRLMLREG